MFWVLKNNHFVFPAHKTKGYPIDLGQYMKLKVRFMQTSQTGVVSLPSKFLLRSTNLPLQPKAAFSVFFFHSKGLLPGNIGTLCSLFSWPSAGVFLTSYVLIQYCLIPVFTVSCNTLIRIQYYAIFL